MSDDDVLAEIDDALDDYETWRGSADAATWRADGTHERGPRTIPTTPAQHRLAQGCGAEPLEETA